MSIIQLAKKNAVLRDGDASIFLLRHAEKPIVESMHEDIGSSITEDGIRSARMLGKVLHRIYPELGVVRSSPIKRCVETAHNMVSVYSKRFQVISDTILGGDGPYVSDNQLAAEHFSLNPSQKDIFIRMQRGEGFAGLRELNVGTGLLLVRILHDLEDISCPGFYITHDCILALFVNTLIGQIVDEKNWFNYLDGLGIKKTNNRIKLYCHDECFDITKKVNDLIAF